MCPFGLDIVGAGPRLDSGIVLVVTVLPGSLAVEAAEEVVYQLCLVLDRFGFGSMSIEMCEGKVIPFHAPPPQAGRYAQSNKLDFQHVYRVGPIVGISIGPATSSVETGSLGFFLKLDQLDSGQVKFLAATCHHVVAPGIDEPLTWHAQVAVASPSINDHAALIASLLSLRTGPLGMGNPSAVGNASDSVPLALAAGGTVLASTGSDNGSLLSIAKGFEPHLGSVLLTSGMADTCPQDKCRLDWALVDVASARLPAGSDTLSNRPPASLLSHAATFDFHSAGPGEDVLCKIGRTTGPTVGKLHSPWVEVRVYRPAGYIQSAERVITAYNDTTPFALPGDSGALVYGAQGQGLGMVWGGFCSDTPQSIANTELGMVVCFTPLDTLYRDMSTRLARQCGEGKIRLTWLG